MTKPRPRDYQLEALEWALSRERAIVCMPTGSGKTLVAGLWIERLLSARRARKILVLEPTRFLVEQTAQVLRRLGLPAEPVHGSMSRGLRRRGWSATVVVATPEIVVSEGFYMMEEPDALVVDECHHTTGQDPYTLVARRYRPRWRLGLTAYIPPSRRAELESYLGEARCWSWSDPRLAKYIPEWAGEVYEAPFNEAERRLYEGLERLWDRLHGVERVTLGNALRWMARDGPLALRESYSRGGLLGRLLKVLDDLIRSPKVRPAHKLEALERILRDHEQFRKAIVFVDRVSIARLIADSLASYNPVLLLGRRHIDPGEALERARSPDSRLIVATSAGEEGIDLPEADLLIVWSNTASPLRFIQRLGRLLRPGSGGQKVAVFIATPDTVDMDSLIDGLVEAERAGIRLGLSVEAVERVWSLSRKRRVLEALEEEPMPVDLLAQALGAPRRRVEAAVKWLLDHGYLAYIYTPAGRVYGPRYMPGAFYRRYRESLEPVEGVEATLKVQAPDVVRTLRGSYPSVLSRLLIIVDAVRLVAGIRGQARFRVGAIERAVNFSYSYTIDSRSLASLVVDNIFAAPRWAV